MAFDEIRLNLGIDYETIATYQFNTSIVVAGDGSEQRRINATQPLARYQIGDRTLSKSDLDYIRDFHGDRQGRLNGFRFKDWADWFATAQPLGTGDGSEQTYQLVKAYTVAGDWGSYTVLRSITKPVANTVVLYVDGEEADLDDWSIDTTTGVVTASLDGTITADFEFDVPVRFEQDAIAFTLEAFEDGSTQIYTLKPVTLIEVRLSLAAIDNPVPIPNPPKLISQRIDLGIDLSTEGAPAYSTNVLAVGSGFESRVGNWEQSRARFNLAQRTLDTAGLSDLITWFRCTHGAAITFYYYDYQRGAEIPVRFEEDAIAFSFEAYESPSRAIFRLNALSLTEIIFPDNGAIVIGQTQGTNIWLYINFLDGSGGIQGGIVSGPNSGTFGGGLYSVRIPQQTPGQIVSVYANGSSRLVGRMVTAADSGGRWIYWQSGGSDADRRVVSILNVYAIPNSEVGGVTDDYPNNLLDVARSLTPSTPRLAW